MKIVISVALAFLLIGCSSDEPTKSSTQAPAEVKEVAAVVEKVVQEKKEEVVVEVEKAEVAVVDEVAVVAPVAVKSGKDLYKGCIGCHGAKGEKVALGKSKIIQGWDTQKTIDALNGYVDGSYGGVMKGTMQGQVKKFSSDEIKAISEYISTL